MIIILAHTGQFRAECARHISRGKSDRGSLKNRLLNVHTCCLDISQKDSPTQEVKTKQLP